MTALVRANLTGLLSRNASSACKIYASLFLSLRFFSTTREKQLVNSSAVLDFLRHKHQFSNQVALNVASVLSRLKDPENADAVLLFLKESGFSKTQVEKIVKYRPQYLLASLDAIIKPRIKTFQDFDMTSVDIAKLITSNPMILQLNPNTRVIPALSVLKGLLGSNDDVTKLLRKSAWFLTNDLEKTMLPNIELLRSCGISMDRIVRFLYCYPRFFLMKPEIIRKSIDKAEEMGSNLGSNMFIHAIRVVAFNRKALELKLQPFRNFGFSEGDIMTMFRKAPTVFAQSIERTKMRKELLLATGKYDLSCIVDNPISLACSIEKRYKPRLQVLGILENRNLIKRWPGLGTMYSISDEKFFEKFVCPYSNEVGELCIIWSSAREKKNALLKELE